MYGVIKHLKKENVRVHSSQQYNIISNYLGEFRETSTAVVQFGTIEDTPNIILYLTFRLGITPDFLRGL